MIDAHLHLQHLPHKQVLAEILRRARDYGLRSFFCNAIKLEDCGILSELASGYDVLTPFYGIHPWMAGDLGEGWDREIERFITEPSSGIGEIGLDRVRETDFSLQKAVFLRQMELAAIHCKPVVIHCVQAWGEMMPVLREYAGKVRFLMHGFRGSREILDEIMKLGGYVTFSWKLFKRKYGEPIEKVAGLIRQVPAERLLLETDFPYIGEKVFSTLTAEQYFECLEETCRIAAELTKMEVSELKERVERNGTAFLHGTIDR
ncbi:MAG TPA: TatD family hydrolase [Candidatus Omnitrophota bacterium]|jgi:TatD DNase family protein|nr:MAG: putative deoxyribonuclease YcfH [Candidatus Omnitrophica bacterium ADurb.Bin314]HOE69164.1 TatD family hydrolase [Candidatus Omnitrophota bacterium]HQB93906.1 TatD family hydrolase [Candidatus Omnitrophota bacterium]